MITRRELRRQREQSGGGAPAVEGLAADLRGRHLLLLDAEIEVSDVLALVHNRLPDVPPRLNENDQVRLSRHSRLSAGVDLDEATVAALEIPEWSRRAVVLDTPRDREPAPPPEWFEDADGLHEAFPAGLPDREEERALSLLISIASRLHLAIRLADEDGMGTRVLVPDPEAKVDLYLYSPYWLDPDVALSLVRTHAPHAFQQELPTPDAAVLAQTSLDDPLFDSSAPVVLDGYSLLIPLGEIDEAAGAIEIRVTEAEWVPPIVRASTELPQIEYHVHWMDAEEVRYRPGHDRRFRQMRAEVAALVDRIGAELLSRSDGIGLDENGFLVTSAQLRA
ncbi:MULTISPECIES: hypothetical protein [Brevibacterium]|uniref:Uncharacterized protein n=4 Tax=Actinomycetes TaxID=1760 RepID=K9B0D6_9MICO|nr:hypothetical protein [Brevibacterium casei]NJE67675.1 hypothetical protein [Brevibacterium sp. LS14]SIG89078.1 Uncharacterised protein [Mycobacteroides abscessus subsp. abscessus]EKU48272.1 hypothetical protein C272_05169 [Brevibacterium casei S18]MCT1447980.1 hypothetical protein [Brevibacterium casei]MCT1550876.1 hypothetical protein [Brevibacterium casei]